ncbi:MAG: tRNA pseudouridine(38-40) synthase TruA [Candidatus Nanopelagicales bacterium]
MPEPHDEPAGDGGLIRVRGRLAYDGADFHGWARQPGLRTVQAVVEDALGVVLHCPAPRTVCAGRTDAGVHARGQQLHLDLSPATWQGGGGPQVALRRLNGVLPPDVRVLDLDLAPEGFDARFSARWRRYRYAVADRRPVDPLRRRELVAWPGVLDVAAMNRAAQALLGEHDFAAFCKRRPGAGTVRTLIGLEWRREDDGVAALSIAADAFCHSMVRSIVGALLMVGDGRRREEWLAELLVAGVRSSTSTVAPAHGLVLEHVEYHEDLAGQARRARRVRG